MNLLNKKYYFLFVLICCVEITFAQYTAIPDSNFEQYLISQGIDTDGIINGQVLTADIETVTNVIVPSRNIQDLTGIEDFEALEELDCTGNSLTFLYLNNPNLKELYCGLNFMSGYDTLDVSACTALEILYCGGNGLRNLDLTANTNLKELIMHYDSTGEYPYNHFEFLDLSNNPNLTKLFSHSLDGFIENLNLRNGNNELLTFVDIWGLPDCFQVDDAAAANNGEGVYALWDCYDVFIVKTVIL